MNNFQNTLNTLDTDNQQDGLQIDGAKLMHYLKDGNTKEKTATTRHESTADGLGKLNENSKNALKSAIDDALRNHLTVTLQNGATCPSIVLMNKYATFEEAKKNVLQGSENELNICAALLALHHFLTTNNRLDYVGVPQYASQFCPTKSYDNQNRNNGTPIATPQPANTPLSTYESTGDIAIGTPPETGTYNADGTLTFQNETYARVPNTYVTESKGIVWTKNGDTNSKHYELIKLIDDNTSSYQMHEVTGKTSPNSGSTNSGNQSIGNTNTIVYSPTDNNQNSSNTAKNSPSAVNGANSNAQNPATSSSSDTNGSYSQLNKNIQSTTAKNINDTTNQQTNQDDQASKVKETTKKDDKLSSEDIKKTPTIEEEDPADTNQEKTDKLAREEQLSKKLSITIGDNPIDKVESIKTTSGANMLKFTDPTSKQIIQIPYKMIKNPNQALELEIDGNPITIGEDRYQVQQIDDGDGKLQLTLTLDPQLKLTHMLQFAEVYTKSVETLQDAPLIQQTLNDIKLGGVRPSVDGTGGYEREVQLPYTQQGKTSQIIGGTLHFDAKGKLTDQEVKLKFLGTDLTVPVSAQGQAIIFGEIPAQEINTLNTKIKAHRQQINTALDSTTLAIQAFPHLARTLNKETHQDVFDITPHLQGPYPNDSYEIDLGSAKKNTSNTIILRLDDQDQIKFANLHDPHNKAGNQPELYQKLHGQTPQNYHLSIDNDKIKATVLDSKADWINQKPPLVFTNDTLGILNIGPQSKQFFDSMPIVETDTNGNPWITYMQGDKIMMKLPIYRDPDQEHKRVLDQHRVDTDHNQFDITRAISTDQKEITDLCHALKLAPTTILGNPLDDNNTVEESPLMKKFKTHLTGQAGEEELTNPPHGWQGGWKPKPLEDYKNGIWILDPQDGTYNRAQIRQGSEKVNEEDQPTAGKNISIIGDTHFVEAKRSAKESIITDLQTLQRIQDTNLIDAGYRRSGDKQAFAPQEGIKIIGLDVETVKNFLSTVSTPDHPRELELSFRVNPESDKPRDIPFTISLDNKGRINLVSINGSDAKGGKVSDIKIGENIYTISLKEQANNKGALQFHFKTHKSPDQRKGELSDDSNIRNDTNTGSSTTGGGGGTESGNNDQTNPQPITGGTSSEAKKPEAGLDTTQQQTINDLKSTLGLDDKSNFKINTITNGSENNVTIHATLQDQAFDILTNQDSIKTNQDSIENANTLKGQINDAIIMNLHKIDKSKFGDTSITKNITGLIATYSGKNFSDKKMSDFDNFKNNNGIIDPTNINFSQQ